jgi:rubrerythrin
MASDNSSSGFLFPKFGVTPEEDATDNQQVDDWADEEIEEVESDFLQAFIDDRDSFLRQLQRTWKIEQLSIAEERFHALISKGEKQAKVMVHKQDEMLEVLNLTAEMCTLALKVARHKFESKQAEEAAERERKRLQKQKEEEEREERDKRKRKEREEQDKRDQAERDRIQPSVPVSSTNDKCPKCGGVLGFGCRLCYTCASGFGPKSDKCPNCGGITGYDGKLCFSCANGNGPPIKVRLDRCPKCGGLNGLPGSLCFSCANW